MIVKLAKNRVRRAYIGGGRIDQLIDGCRGEDGYYPEDWLASTVEASNPGYMTPGEGLGKTEDGKLINQLIPQGLPILVKLLDSAGRLVIQAHPTRSFAMKHWHSPVGKTESWYMIETDDDACVYIGFQEHASRELWTDCFKRQDIPGMLSLLHCFPVGRGDCVFVPGGVPHAIGGGCLMVETQEPSDLMVIPERMTPTGLRLSSEKMHGGLGFETMMDCFSYDALSREEARRRYFMQPRALDAYASLLIDGAENGIFSVLNCLIPANQTYRCPWIQSIAIAVVISGSGTLDVGADIVRVKKGDRLLLTGLSNRDLQVSPLSEGLSVVFSLPAA